MEGYTKYWGMAKVKNTRNNTRKISLSFPKIRTCLLRAILDPVIISRLPQIMIVEAADLRKFDHFAAVFSLNALTLGISIASPRALLGLAVLEDLTDCEADVFCDLPKQNRRDVAALMKRDRRAASRAVAELLVRTALAHFHEA